MPVSNDDVPNGHANGTRVLLEAVVVKEGVSPCTMEIDGLKCPVVEASEVDHIICSLERKPNEQGPKKLFHGDSSPDSGQVNPNPRTNESRQDPTRGRVITRPL